MYVTADNSLPLRTRALVPFPGCKQGDTHCDQHMHKWADPDPAHLRELLRLVYAKPQVKTYMDPSLCVWTP